jgi:hypothetical protein
MLEPTSKEYVICRKCGKFNWIDFGDRMEGEEFEPEIKGNKNKVKKPKFKKYD